MKNIYLAIFLLFVTLYCRGSSIPLLGMRADTTVFDKTKDTTILFFDPSKIKAEEWSKVYSILSKLALKNNFRTTHKVAANEDINHLIKKFYNIVNQKDFHVSEALKSELQKTNKLGPKLTIVEGQNLVLPRLPIKRSDSSKTEYTQFFDFYNGKTYVSSTMAIAKGVPSNMKEKKPITTGGLIAIKLIPEDLKYLKSSLSKEVYRKLYGSGLVSLDSVKSVKVYYLSRAGRRSTQVNTAPPQTDTALMRMLKGLDNQQFGKYFVFDTFNGSSDHGDKVMDVINDRFKSCGLDTAGLPIIKIPTNYFDNMSFGKDLLQRYYASMAGTKVHNVEEVHEMTILNALDSSAANFVNCDDCIPEIYLSALFKYHYNFSPDLISSSFYADMLDRDILPHLANSRTNLITAALNDDVSIDDRVRNVYVDSDLVSVSVQPINDYYNAYPGDGCMIIGNRINQGVFHGAWGTHVTTLGQGTGWNGTSIRDTDSGTSFATPDVAAKLYIAKAYWKSRQDRPLAQEARIRSLLATDIDPQFIGKFESGGTLNLLKLLQTQNYAELPNGEIVPVKAINYNASYLGISMGERQKFRRRYVDKKGYTYDGICGLAYCDGKFYSFRDANPKWEPTDFESINLTVTTDLGTVVINTKDEFISKFKQLIILKNQ